MIFAVNGGDEDDDKGADDIGDGADDVDGDDDTVQDLLHGICSNALSRSVIYVQSICPCNVKFRCQNHSFNSVLISLSDAISD